MTVAGMDFGLSKEGRARVQEQAQAQAIKAVNDARTMGDTLKQLGFTVMVAENQNRQAFSQTLLAFDKSVEAGDTAFSKIEGSIAKSLIKLDLAKEYATENLPAPVAEGGAALGPQRGEPGVDTAPDT